MAGLGGEVSFSFVLSFFCQHSSPNWPQRWLVPPPQSPELILSSKGHAVAAGGRRTEVVPVGADVSRVSSRCPRLQGHHSHGSSGKEEMTLGPSFPHRSTQRLSPHCRRLGSNTRPPCRTQYPSRTSLAACGHRDHQEQHYSDLEAQPTSWGHSHLVCDRGLQVQRKFPMQNWKATGRLRCV